MISCFLHGVLLLLPGCSEPLGMKSGHIQDYQITASSVFRTLNMDMFTWEPRKARLDKQGKVNAWTSGHNDQSQWLQVMAWDGFTVHHSYALNNFLVATRMSELLGYAALNKLSYLSFPNWENRNNLQNHISSLYWYIDAACGQVG